jgi:hypothetical protein
MEFQTWRDGHALGKEQKVVNQSPSHVRRVDEDSTPYSLSWQPVVAD